MQYIFSNLLIGILSGIISGIFVSRFFVIQENYQNQIDSIERLLRKLLFSKASLEMCRKVLELKHDTREAARKEANEKQYKSIDEYYYVHKEEDWISATDAISAILNHMKEHFETIQNISIDLEITEKDLRVIYYDAKDVFSQVQSINELSFSSLNKITEEIDKIETQYNKYRKTVHRKLIGFIVKDKVIISIVAVLIIVIVGSIMI